MASILKIRGAPLSVSNSHPQHPHPTTLRRLPPDTNFHKDQIHQSTSLKTVNHFRQTWFLLSLQEFMNLVQVD